MGTLISKLAKAALADHSHVKITDSGFVILEDNFTFIHFASYAVYQKKLHPATPSSGKSKVSKTVVAIKLENGGYLYKCR